MRADSIRYGEMKGEANRANVMDLIALYPTEKTTKAGIDLLFGTGPSIMTQEIVDPMKQRVASPLSRYLESQVGKGLPRYSGALSYEFSPEEKRSYSDFLSLDAGDWFDKAVADPATKRFKEDFLPIIREGYAGSLRGSGRFRAEEAGIGRLSEALATQRYQAEREIPAQQFAMATEYKRQMDINYAREYNDWMKSLPQMNPALEQALKFLSEDTSTGTTILTMNDPGSKGLIGDILGIVGGMIS